MLYVSSILLVSLPRYTHFFFLMIRRPPRSTLFPYRRSSDLLLHTCRASQLPDWWVEESSQEPGQPPIRELDRKSTRLNSSHDQISYAVFCLKKKTHRHDGRPLTLSRR